MNKEVREFFNEIKVLLRDREASIKLGFERLEATKAEFPLADFSEEYANLTGLSQELCRVSNNIFCAYENRLESESKDSVEACKRESGFPIGDTLKRTAKQSTVKSSDAEKVNIVIIDQSGGTKEYKQSTDDEGRIVLEIKESD